MNENIDTNVTEQIDNKPPKKKTPLVLIFLLVIVCAAVGVGAWLLGGKTANKNSNEKTEEKKEEQKEENSGEKKTEETEDPGEESGGNPVEADTDIYVVDKIPNFNETKELDFNKIESYYNKKIVVDNAYLYSGEKQTFIGYIVYDGTISYFKNVKTNKIFASKNYSFSDYSVRLAQGQGYNFTNDRYIRIVKDNTMNVYDTVNQKKVFKNDIKGEAAMKSMVYVDKNGNFLVDDNGYKIVDANEKVLVSGYDYIDNSGYDDYYIVIKNNKAGILKDYKVLVEPTYDVDLSGYYDGKYKPAFQMCCSDEPTYNFTLLNNGNILFDTGYENDRFNQKSAYAYLLSKDGKLIKKIDYLSEKMSGKSTVYLLYDKSKNVIVATVQLYDETEEYYKDVKTINYSPETGEIVK